jgi:thiol-disulfide isomerase/thioredoxin
MSIFEDPSKAGALQETQILTLVQTPPPPKHIIKLFFSKECPHCKIVIPQVEEYVKKHPDILLLKVDATTQEGTDQLEAMLKGMREVPALLIDDTISVKGEINLLPRLTLAVQLADSIYDIMEEKSCLFRK